MKVLMFAIFLSQLAFAYVPPVESLFRNGENPDIQSNTLYLNGALFKLTATGEGEEILFHHRWLYHFQENQKLKFAQLIYSSASYQEETILDKYYSGNLNAHMFSDQTNAQIRGIFYSLMNSLLINDGSFLMEFLKDRKVDVSHNYALINRSKKALLDRYKRYLAEKNSKEVESPLDPASVDEKVKVRATMAENLILDKGQVSLAKLNEEVVWFVNTPIFKAWVSDHKREIRKMIYRLDSGDLEIYLKEYFVIDGVHKFPRAIHFKMPSGDHYRMEFSQLRYFNESEGQFVERMKKVDQVLSGKRLPVKPEMLF